MQDQYHHYIPRFLLRNFAIDKHERRFESRENKESNIKQQKGRRVKQKKKKNIVKEKELLQTYDRTRNQLGVSPIARTYGYKNMYKDLNHKDVMHVEEKLSKLEGKASKTVQDIIKASQEKNQVILIRKDLEDLRKFLYIMCYRNGCRWFQFKDKKFDDLTFLAVKSFMQQYNLQSPQEVWLQNIREILDTPHEKIKDNERIFNVDRLDYENISSYFLAIWQAGKNDEFLITSNGFGIFEGANSTIPLLNYQFKHPYHLFYVISPKLALVLCHLSFREEIGPETIYNLTGERSIFDNIPHTPATVIYNPINSSSNKKGRMPFDTPFDISLNGIGFERRRCDKFTFPFAKLSSAAVRLVNSMFLNEAKSDLVLTFLSRPYLYKTIIKFYKDENLGEIEQDFSDLKRVLFKALNKTHEEDLHLRRNIPANSTCILHVRDTNS